MPELHYGRYVNPEWRPADIVRLQRERRQRMGFFGCPVPRAPAISAVETTVEYLGPWSTPRGEFFDILPKKPSLEKRIAAIISTIDMDFIQTNKHVTCQHILWVCARVYGVTLEDLLGPSRAREYTQPRQIGFCIAALMTKLSIPGIGRCAHRDHTTIIHAYKLFLQRVVAVIRTQGSEPLIARMEDVLGVRGAKFKVLAHGVFYGLEAAE